LYIIGVWKILGVRNAGVSAILKVRRSIAKTWQMVKIVWTDSAIEDLNAVGESLVELPEPKPKKKKKL